MACHSLEGVTHPLPLQVKPSERKHWFCLGKKKRGCSQQKGKGTNPSLQSQKKSFFPVSFRLQTSAGVTLWFMASTLKSQGELSLVLQCPGGPAPPQTSSLWVSCRTLNCASPSSFCPAHDKPCENCFWLELCELSIWACLRIAGFA